MIIKAVTSSDAKTFGAIITTRTMDYKQFSVETKEALDFFFTRVRDLKYGTRECPDLHLCLRQMIYDVYTEIVCIEAKTSEPSLYASWLLMQFFCAEGKIDLYDAWRHTFACKLLAQGACALWEHRE